MNLIHKTVLLRRGTLIRIIGSRCNYDPDVYQYVVDMLFPNNIWRRIRVSIIHKDLFIMILEVLKLAESSKNNFKITFLTKQAREKYGKETRLSQVEGSTKRISYTRCSKT